MHICWPFGWIRTKICLKYLTTRLNGCAFWSLIRSILLLKYSRYYYQATFHFYYLYPYRGKLHKVLKNAIMLDIYNDPFQRQIIKFGQFRKKNCFYVVLKKYEIAILFSIIWHSSLLFAYQVWGFFVLPCSVIITSLSKFGLFGAGSLTWCQITSNLVKTNSLLVLPYLYANLHFRVWRFHWNHVTVHQ